MCAYVYCLVALEEEDMPASIFSQAKKMLNIAFDLKVVLM